MTKRLQHLSGDALREWRRLQRMFLGLRILARIRPTEQQTIDSLLHQLRMIFVGAASSPDEMPDVVRPT